MDKIDWGAFPSNFDLALLSKKLNGQVEFRGGNFRKLPEAKFEVNDPFLGYGYYLNFEK